MHRRPRLRLMFITGYRDLVAKEEPPPGPILFKPIASGDLVREVNRALQQDRFA